MSVPPVVVKEQLTAVRMKPAADAVHIRDLVYGYRGDPAVLRISRLRIERGGRIFLHGPSGSGKTTLLGLITGVLRANGGMVEVLGGDLTGMSSSARDAFRGSHLGYIFQMFNLIPYLSVLDNIALPCRISSERRKRLGAASIDSAVRTVARQLDIEDLLHQNVTRLSVGQQQRVAAARALLGAPELIVADEPTSSLDADRREDFLNLLFRRCEEASTTLLFVSHDLSLARLFDRSISLPDVNRAGAC